ncbi:hypothetical protein ATANTOWER_014022, partial [Ataeniobius toweri]|nr:hypothetical protein [Ataeniobius toweri]
MKRMLSLLHNIFHFMKNPSVSCETQRSVGGSRSTLRDPTYARGEHTASMQKDQRPQFLYFISLPVKMFVLNSKKQKYYRLVWLMNSRCSSIRCQDLLVFDALIDINESFHLRSKVVKSGNETASFTLKKTKKVA